MPLYLHATVLVPRGSMPNLLIDREEESERLLDLADSGMAKLALIYGRRRIGKTYLLTNLWPEVRVFYFVASATGPEINRRTLITEAAAWAGVPLEPEDHPTWRTVFRALLELKPSKDIVLVIDEFQYLADGSAGLAEVASELNAIWEQSERYRTGGVLLALSGSAVQTLASLTTGGSPLYGRLNWVHPMEPFDYFYAGEMVASYGTADRLRIYAAFGGVPRYLATVDPDRSVEENIIEHLLSPSGEVRLQLETVLAQEEGLRDVAAYQAILTAVANGGKNGRLSRREIAAALNIKNDGALRFKIDRLEDELGLLEAADTYGDTTRRYRVVDPALRFYYGLVLPNASAIDFVGPERVWRERLVNQVFPTYMGLITERVVAQATRRWADMPAVMGWSTWEGTDRERINREVDLVGETLHGQIATGSVRARGRAMGATDLRAHREHLTAIAHAGQGWARAALKPKAPMLFFSMAGFTDAFQRAAAKEAEERPVLLKSARDLWPDS